MRVATAKHSYLDSPYCGDQCGYWEVNGRVTLCVADGLGHGKGAEQAAKPAVDYVARHLSDPLQELFANCDLALRSTRGVAMGVAVIDTDVGRLTYAGIGNTRMMIVGDKTVQLSSNNGIVGGGYRMLTPETVPLEPGALVILFTDGIPERMSISGYFGALRGDVRRLAEKILLDWGRETDDAAVLVFKNGGTNR